MSKVVFRHRISHVIFDVDGLLLDTERLYTQCFQTLLSRWNKTFDSHHKSLAMGLSAIGTAHLLIESFQLPVTVEEFLHLAKQEQLGAFQHCTFMPGAQRIVEYMSLHNIPMGVATSSLRETFLVKTRNFAHVFGTMRATVTGDDPAVKAAKPAPDIFLEAARRMGAQREDCLVFEDSPNGVRAALAAGMHVVWVPDPNIDFRVHHADLVENEVVVKLESLNQFDPRMWGLPDMEV